MAGQKIINQGVSLTFLGHACFKLVSPQGTVILLDPWITNNPQVPEEAKTTEKIDYLLVTHAHGDHLGDTLELAKNRGATVVSMPEIANYLNQKGLPPEKTIGMNKGGSISLADFRVTMVNAFHSSSFWEGGQIIYGGEAAGFIVRFNNGFTVYHAGDTGVFGDMKIIGELYKPDIALLPIGSHYVMNPEEAAYASKLLQPDYVIPMHYGTFPVLTGTPEKFLELMKSFPEIKVLVLKPGETIE